MKDTSQYSANPPANKTATSTNLTERLSPADIDRLIDQLEQKLADSNPGKVEEEVCAKCKGSCFCSGLKEFEADFDERLAKARHPPQLVAQSALYLMQEKLYALDKQADCVDDEEMASNSTPGISTPGTPTPSTRSDASEEDKPVGPSIAEQDKGTVSNPVEVEGDCPSTQNGQPAHRRSKVLAAPPNDLEPQGVWKRDTDLQRCHGPQNWTTAQPKEPRKIQFYSGGIKSGSQRGWKCKKCSASNPSLSLVQSCMQCGWEPDRHYPQYRCRECNKWGVINLSKEPCGRCGNDINPNIEQWKCQKCKRCNAWGAETCTGCCTPRKLSAALPATTPEKRASLNRKKNLDYKKDAKTARKLPAESDSDEEQPPAKRVRTKLATPADSEDSLFPPSPTSTLAAKDRAGSRTPLAESADKITRNGNGERDDKGKRASTAGGMYSGTPPWFLPKGKPPQGKRGQ